MKNEIRPSMAVRHNVINLEIYSIPFMKNIIRIGAHRQNTSNAIQYLRLISIALFRITDTMVNMIADSINNEKQHTEKVIGGISYITSRLYASNARLNSEIRAINVMMVKIITLLTLISGIWWSREDLGCPIPLSVSHSPQCLHFLAAAFISSPQYGHFFISSIILEVLNIHPQFHRIDVSRLHNPDF